MIKLNLKFKELQEHFSQNSQFLVMGSLVFINFCKDTTWLIFLKLNQLQKLEVIGFLILSRT